MFNVSTFPQLSDALRYKAQELLVMGQVAEEIFEAVEATAENRPLRKNIHFSYQLIELLQSQYDIVIFENAENIAYMLLCRKH